MKVLIIGASGHTGSYLVPQLLADGHEVVAVMRGNRTPYGWTEEILQKITVVKTDRASFIEQGMLADLGVDVVCDLIAYDIDSVKALTSQIKNDAFYLQVGSIWTYENKVYLPVDENHPKNSVQTYGKQTGIIEDYLLGLAKDKKLRTCVVHPGHISGKEWQPINPQGNLDITVFDKIKKGEELVLPFLGLNTVQHIHAYDLAQIIYACIQKQDIANGEAFIAVAERAMTLRGICEALYAHYGQKPNLRFVEWEEFVQIVGERQADISMDHIFHSPCCTVEKAEKMLGLKMKYSIMDIFYEYLAYQGM